MNQYCMFPTPTQLMSLDFEFGVPLKWKTEKQSEIEEISLEPVKKSEPILQPLAESTT